MYEHFVRKKITLLHTPVSVGVAVFSQGHLDELDLLGDGRQHSLFQTIELIKAPPGPHLAQTHEDTAHSLKKKTFKYLKLYINK